VSRLVVELAGPAGAGKTTLARALRVADTRGATIGVHMGRSALAAGIAPLTPRLTVARMSARGRWWTRDELRNLAYLSAWQGAVGQGDRGRADHGQGLLLLDHGPVFRLASLAAFGPPMGSTPAFDRLWTGLARDWGRLLDVVVWLDAPDEVLLRRIAGRAQRHRIRGVGDIEAARFLARYRAAYRNTLDVVTSGGARLVELDTAAGTPEQLTAELLAAVLGPSTRSSP
jgi:adenylate kinase family enzyme